MLQQLIEETGDLYDGFAFLVGELWRSSGQRNHSPTFIVGGLFFCSDGSPTCFGQECFQLQFVRLGSRSPLSHRTKSSMHVFTPPCNECFWFAKLGHWSTVDARQRVLVGDGAIVALH